MTSARQALATGFVLGALWGAVEALVVMLIPWQAHSLAMGRLQPFDGLGALAVMALAAWRYAPVLALVAVLVSPLMALPERLLDRGARAAGARALRAPRAVIATLVFVNLFWWTKPLWAFSWGRPFHDPGRLALSAGWMLLATALAWCVVRPGGQLLRVPSGRAFVLWLVLLSLGGGWALWREADLTAVEPPAAEGARPPNVLLVVVDALRADRLGCYGHELDPPVSPHVDALAAQGVVFDQAVVQAPFTWTSFGSMLTGKYPRRHGLIKMSPDQRLDTRRNRTLAQALQEQGYATGAFLTGTLSNNTGLLRGFDTYFETIVGHEPINRHSRWSGVRGRLLLSVLWNKLRQALDVRLVNTEALDWIEDHADVPFFALVHYYSTHTPYDPPAPYDTRYNPGYDGPFERFFQSHAVSIMKAQHAGVCPADGRPTWPTWSCEHFRPERDVPQIRALYDGGVAFADDMFGDLMALLEAEGIADDTLVVFTADHGEELYDHGIFEHDWMFNTNLLIPLVMRLPGGAHAGTRVTWPVEEIDIPATVLAVAGVGTLAEQGEDGATLTIDGRSLLPDMAGQRPGDAQLLAASENVRYVAVQDEHLKLVRNRFAPDQFRVFDLEADPGEHAPVDLLSPAWRPRITELLSRWSAYDRSQPDASSFAAGTLDIESLRMLARLGYTAGLPEAVLEKLDRGEVSDVEALLSDTSLVGSNEILEESLYEHPIRWPPVGGDGD